MTSVASKVFRSGNSEAVRLPREVAYGRDIDVVVERHGDVVTIYPKPEMDFREMLRELRKLPRPTTVQEREPIEFPDRPGL
jgi:antitoxin VapB